jgi:hypothetical protein
MCDHSRRRLSSRLASEGELLVTYRFPTQLIAFASAMDLEKVRRERSNQAHERHWWSVFTRGFAKTKHQIPVVCIPPGARLRMTHVPTDLRARWALRPVEYVWFTQTGADPEHCRDAVRLGNGRLILLRTLPEEVSFLVLSLGSDDDFVEVQTPVWPDDVASDLSRRAWSARCETVFP